MFLRPSRFAVVLAAAMLMATTARANLVTNGGFETGDFSGWSTQAAGSGSVFHVGLGGHTGTYAAVFAATAAQDDQIYQTVPTMAGTQYTLSFWVLNLGVGNDHLRVSWEGATVLDESPVSHPLETWDFVSIPVTATMNGSELRFGAFDGPAGMALDDICLTEVPEPASLGLLAAGGLWVARRRRA